MNLTERESDLKVNHMQYISNKHIPKEAWYLISHVFWGIGDALDYKKGNDDCE